MHELNDLSPWSFETFAESDLPHPENRRSFVSINFKNFTQNVGKAVRTIQPQKHPQRASHSDLLEQNKEQGFTFETFGKEEEGLCDSSVHPDDSPFLVTKKKTDVKTAQRSMRHAKSTTVLGHYTQMEELISAQEMMLDAIFAHAEGTVQ